jgi:putative NIF3 family GTP cyclohydrolase 1 type 2
VRLGELRGFLDELLLVHRFAGDQNGPFAHFRADAPVARLGVALAPSPELAAWVARERLDALVLHRPWGFEGALPVLAYHNAFDERLTTGFNPNLAEALALDNLEVLGYKEGRPLGMIGDVPSASWEALRARVAALFGALEGVYGAPVGAVSRVCVVGAMRPALVYEAAERGAQVYLTGQYRRGAARAVFETGVAVLELGHARSERWGLGVLARLLREAFPNLSVSLHAAEP